MMLEVGVEIGAPLKCGKAKFFSLNTINKKAKFGAGYVTKTTCNSNMTFLSVGREIKSNTEVYASWTPSFILGVAPTPQFGYLNKVSLGHRNDSSFVEGSQNSLIMQDQYLRNFLTVGVGRHPEEDQKNSTNLPTKELPNSEKPPVVQCYDGGKDCKKPDITCYDNYEVADGCK